MGNTTALGANTQSWTYDSTERMYQFSTGGTAQMAYLFNGLGQRVAKLPTGNTAGNLYTVYDESGQIIGDYNYATVIVPVREMIWMDGLPVGVLNPSGSTETLSYIEPDQIGTPRVAISASTNAQVWTWSPLNDPFGETLPTGSITLNNRFPGQVYDLESGLSYNYFRDYDSGTGRAIESDPLGLPGGISTYGYVRGNPLSFADPLGLNPADYFASREDAASDFANYVYSNSIGDNPSFDIGQEVSNWLTPSPNGLCWTYSADNFRKGPVDPVNNYHTPMAPQPGDDSVGIHTHTLLAQDLWHIEASPQDLLPTTSSYGTNGNQFVVGVLPSSQTYPNIYGGVSHAAELWISEYEKSKLFEQYRAGKPGKVDGKSCGCTR